MTPKKQPTSQLGFLSPSLKEQLNPNQPLYLLSEKVDWVYFEKAFSPFYSNQGRPAHPIRLMVSLLILKSMYNHSDESLVGQQWVMNPYYQYFSGFTQLQWKQPCAASDLVHFRKRIGEQGVEKILKHSVDLHAKDGHDNHLSIDTTVQEKYITYPTDAKLRKKVIDKCVRIADQEGIVLRRSYSRTSKYLLRFTYNPTHPKRAKKARSANKSLKTIANRLLRELDRKLPCGHPYGEELALYKKVVEQHRHSKDKVYSLHEPGVYCMSKGKAHKKYEFGVKASVCLTQKTGIIVGAMTFPVNVYHTHTLEGVLGQVQRLTGKLPKTATVDRGYKGTTQMEGTQVIRPSKPRKTDSVYQKRRKRKHCRRRAAIEPVIGQLKSDHRAAVNFLSGKMGDQVNFMLAASGFNFKKLAIKISKNFFWLFQQPKIWTKQWARYTGQTEVLAINSLKMSF